MQGLLASAFVAASSQTSAPVQLIIDTDLAGDVDDVGALCIAHAMADAGEVDILAVVHDSLVPEGVEAVRSINRYFGRGDIPLGSYHDDDYCCNDLRDQGPRPYVHSIAAEAADDETPVEASFVTYRRALAAADDGSVVIALIGFATALLALLHSPPDEHSPLAGPDLVFQKVRRLVWMGGRFPDSRASGMPPEFNFAGREESVWNPDGASGLADITAGVMFAWPAATPITWLGAEVGGDVCHGARLVEQPEDSPCRRAYEAWGSEYGNCCNCDHPDGIIVRQSWDPMVILFAVRAAMGDAAEGGAAELSYLGLSAHQTGHMELRMPEGHNVWSDEPPPFAGQGTQGYLYFATTSAPDAYAAAIDVLLAPHTPPPPPPPTPSHRPPPSPLPCPPPPSPSLSPSPVTHDAPPPRVDTPVPPLATLTATSPPPARPHRSHAVKRRRPPPPPEDTPAPDELSLLNGPSLARDALIGVLLGCGLPGLCLCCWCCCAASRRPRRARPATRVTRKARPRRLRTEPDLSDRAIELADGGEEPEPGEMECTGGHRGLLSACASPSTRL